MWFWNTLRDVWAFFSAPVMVEVYGWIIGGGVLAFLAWGVWISAVDGWREWSRWVVRRFPPK